MATRTHNGLATKEENTVKRRSQDVNDIEFKFDGLEQEKKAPDSNVNTRDSKPVLHRKAITVEVIAKLKALDIVSMGPSPISTQERSLLLSQSSALDQTLLQAPSEVINPGQGIRAVEINRTQNEPLGFFIRQGDGWCRKDGIFVSRITPGSLVECRRILTVGDEILEVNGVSLAGFSLHDVVQLIQIPKRLILTLHVGNKIKRPRQKLSNRQRSAPDLLSSPSKNKTDNDHDSRSSREKTSRLENHRKRTTGSEEEKNKQKNVYDHNSNANAVESNSTAVDGLIEALRSQHKGHNSDEECTSAQQSEDLANRSLTRIDPCASNEMEFRSQKSTAKDLVLYAQSLSHSLPNPKAGSPGSVRRKRASTITPPTTVNLIFDDDDTVPNNMDNSIAVQGQMDVYRRELDPQVPLLSAETRAHKTVAEPSTELDSNISGLERINIAAQDVQFRVLPAQPHPYRRAPEAKHLGTPFTDSTAQKDARGLNFGDTGFINSSSSLPRSEASKLQKSPYRRGPDFIGAVDNAVSTTKSQLEPKSDTQTNNITVVTPLGLPMGLPMSLPNSRGSSPGGSPKARRRLPSIPSEVDDPRKASPPKTDSSSKKLLSVPGNVEGRTHRKLPTPPPSPLADRKSLGMPPARRDSSWSSEQSSDAESNYSQSPSSDKSGGFSLSQLVEKATKSLQADIRAKTQKDKAKEEGERKYSHTQSASRPVPYKRSQSAQCTDFFEQQRHSMLLHSYAFGNMQSASGMSRTLPGDNTVDITGMTVPPRQRVNSEAVLNTKPTADSPSAGKPRERISSDVSPSFFRRASSSLLMNKLRASQTSAQPVNDTCQLKIERQPGFLVYPDNYVNEDLTKSHAVSGMVQMRIIKATQLPFPDRKRKKIYCAIEVDFERKAFTSAKKVSKSISWDEVFEVEIQHGREMCLACSTSNNREFDKPVARILFFLSPLVRCGQTHQVVFKLQPSGLLHVELEFTELKTLLKRVQSSKTSGVFGFRLNVTSELEHSNVPLLVRKCVEEIEKRGLDCVGLYRISGNARRKKELRGQFDDNCEAVDISEENCPDINVITGILKDYLRELPEPLITEKMTEGLVKGVQDNIQNEDPGTQKRALSKLLSELPETNRHTLVFILNHLRRVVARKDVNKMDMRNLSVCLAPVLQCSPTNLTDSKDLLDLKLYLKTVEVVLQMWCNLEDIT